MNILDLLLTLFFRWTMPRWRNGSIIPHINEGNSLNLIVLTRSSLSSEGESTKTKLSVSWWIGTSRSLPISIVSVVWCRMSDTHYPLPTRNCECFFKITVRHLLGWMTLRDLQRFHLRRKKDTPLGSVCFCSTFLSTCNLKWIPHPRKTESLKLRAPFRINQGSCTGHDHAKYRYFVEGNAIACLIIQWAFYYLE